MDIDREWMRRKAWDREPGSLAGQAIVNRPLTPYERAVRRIQWTLAVAIGAALIVLWLLVLAAYGGDVTVLDCAHAPGTRVVVAEVRDGVVGCRFASERPSAAPWRHICEARPRGTVWPRITVWVLEGPSETAAACMYAWAGTYGQATMQELGAWKRLKGE